MTGLKFLLAAFLLIQLILAFSINAEENIDRSSPIQGESALWFEGVDLSNESFWLNHAVVRGNVIAVESSSDDAFLLKIDLTQVLSVARAIETRGLEIRVKPGFFDVHISEIVEGDELLLCLVNSQVDPTADNVWSILEHSIAFMPNQSPVFCLSDRWFEPDLIVNRVSYFINGLRDKSLTQEGLLRHQFTVPMENPADIFD